MTPNQTLPPLSDEDFKTNYCQLILKTQTELPETKVVSGQQEPFSQTYTRCRVFS